MADIAGGLAGPSLPVAGLTAEPPRDPGDGRAPEARALGADTDAVLSSLATR